jgi:plasmid segregation protein ParM
MSKNNTSLLENHTMHVGLDDGHNGIKIYAGKDVLTNKPIQFKMQSRGVVGYASMGDPNKTEQEVILVNGEAYTISENLASYENTRNEEYATSKLSKALVYQALRLANLNCKNLKITSGLPVNRFYGGLNRSMNQELINQKKNNLLDMGDVYNLYDHKKGIEPIRIIDHKVLCEANAAFIDIIMDDDGNDTEIALDLELIEYGAGIIDIGGRTTDCVVVNPNGDTLNAARSGTKDIGILSLKDELSHEMKVKYNLNHINEAALTKAMVTGIYGTGLNKRDISELLEQHKENLFNSISGFLDTTIGDGSDLPAIILVGGGGYLLKDHIEAKYPNVIIPEDMEFANARGFYKIYKYIL